MKSKHMNSKHIDVAIVGGGASGVAVVSALANLAHPPSHVAVFEQKSSRIARGHAYGERSHSHLLNVPADKMGILEERSTEFSQWLSEQGYQHAPGDFVERYKYGRYLEERLEESLPRFQHAALVKKEVTTVRKSGDGSYTLTTSDGDIISCRIVVLAIGNFPRHALRDRFPIEGIHSVWDLCPEDLPRNGHVVIAGTSLSALDILFDLEAQGFLGKVTLVSRQGSLPHVHDHTTSSPSLPNLLEDLSSASRLKEVTKLIGVHLRENSFAHWQGTVDSLRDLTPLLWKRFSVAEKHRFHRHLGRRWGNARHRIPVSAEELLKLYSQQERLTIIPGAFASVKVLGEGSFRIELSCKGGPLFLDAATLIDATGLADIPSSQQSPLLHSLLQDKLLLRDELGLGVQVSESGQALDANGEPHDGLFVIGALRRGSDFESTAVREIRRQAAQISAAVEEICDDTSFDNGHNLPAQ